MFGVHVLGQMPLNCRRSASAAAVGLALVLIHLAVVDSLSYFCLFPQDIRPGSDFTLSVTLFKSGRTTLNAAIVDVSSGSILVNKTETVAVSPVKGKLNTLIKLQIPLIALEPSYRVNISGTGALKFSNSSIVNVRQKSISILIQTDKALYKPGQKVLFRVVTIYPNMKPYKDTMDIIIYDKDRNRIAQWLHEKSDQGVFSGELTLSDLTPLGTWTIQVNTNVDAASKTFDVVEYVLPKYDVDVNLPSFYLLNVNKPQLQLPLHFTVSARYTYGQPVKGVAKLTAKVLTLDTTRHFTWMKSVIASIALKTYSPSTNQHCTCMGM